MCYCVSSFINLAFDQRSRISSFTAVSFLLHASGSGSRTASLLRQNKDVSPQDAHVSSAQHGLLSELPSESTVLARPEAVLVTASVLRLRLSRVRIGRGRLCSSGRGSAEHPPEDFCSIRGALPPESFFSRRGVSLSNGPLQRLCRGTVSCQSVVFHNLHSTNLERRLLI